MDNLYYNLSEEEFSTGRKVLLWSFAGFFLIGGIAVLFVSLVMGHKSIKPTLSLAPFGICLAATAVAIMATTKRKNQFFNIDGEKLEFRYGMLKPSARKIMWNDINEVVIPHRQKKALLKFKDGGSYIIDLTWIQKKKSSHIRRHLFQTAAEKRLRITKVLTLTGKYA
ncbi:MAG TPA: hypothetical protein VK155_11265 [Bacteroidales bacterium]|nr:hypothetical protein [Bacteroidales bacterium]